MSREKWVENTFKNLRKALDKEYIGQIYDNIQAKKFQTKMDIMEGAYRGLGSEESVSRSISGIDFILLNFSLFLVLANLYSISLCFPVLEIIITLRL